MSRIGKKSIKIPEKVTVECRDDDRIIVTGDKGTLEWELPAGYQIDKNEDELSIKCTGGETKQYRAMHGTSRALIANMIEGVSNGFRKDLEIQGVGFRAAVKGQEIVLNLGFSHPINHTIPEGIKVIVTENTKVSIEGIDKQVVGQFAADIRSNYPPEPYKGKGVRYKDEYVRRKEGKSLK